jgi:alpha,alpha-trehalase
MVENYGAILNANRTYFFTRSQPPFLSSMIREVYEHPAIGTPPDLKWLARAYDYAQRDYVLWTSAEHQAGNTGLARYHDLGEGPVPEMADDSSYYPDVIRWLLARPGDHAEYLVEGPAKPTPAQAAALAQTSCDIAASHVCALAVVDGHRLSAAYYRGDPLLSSGHIFRISAVKRNVSSTGCTESTWKNATAPVPSGAPSGANIVCLTVSAICE